MTSNLQIIQPAEHLSSIASNPKNIESSDQQMIRQSNSQSVKSSDNQTSGFSNIEVIQLSDHPKRQLYADKQTMEPLSAVVLDINASPLHTRIPKVTISLLQMLLLNSVVCGVEIVACAGFTYIPPMLLKAGYSEENMGFLLGMGPLMGFLFVPVIGRASDRCYSQFGRRRPFILGLAVLLVCALYLIPFGEYFVSVLFGATPLSKSVGLVVLAVGVVLLDFTTQASLTPCEALLNDASKDSDQSERIFTIYSLMISLGGVIGYLLTAIDWTANPLGVYFGGQEASIFSILIIVYTLMLAATLVVAKEVPLSNSVVPVDIATVNLSSSTLSTFTTSISKLQSVNESGYESSDYSSDDDKTWTKHSRQHTKGSWRSPRYARKMLLKVISFMPNRGQCLANMCGWLYWIGKQMVPSQLIQLFKIPKVLKLLACADVCSWTAIMGFNIYYTDYVGQVVYGGNPNAPESSPEGRAYDEGVRVASWGLLLHCICSAIFSFFIERLTNSYGYRTTFTMGMVSFVFAMMGMVLIHHIYIVNLMAAATGFAYSTVTTIPFMLVSKYHANKKAYFADLPPALLSDSERGIGSDIAVLDWSYFLSQVILTSTMGTVVHITGTLVSYMVTAGSMGILAIYYIGRVIEDETQARKCISGL